MAVCSGGSGCGGRMKNASGGSDSEVEASSEVKRGLEPSREAGLDVAPLLPRRKEGTSRGSPSSV